MRLELRTPVRCEDGPLGELADLVVDPAKRRVTHLVVQPLHSALTGPRLVPIELADAGAAQDGITLRCTEDDFAKLDSIREFAYERYGGLPVDDPEWDVGITDVLAAPLYSPGELGAAGSPGEVAMAYDRIPKDDVELRRSSRVRSSDGRDLGHVEALIVDEQEMVTHFVLEHRRWWTRRPHSIRIPVSSIKEIDTDAVTVALSKKQVRSLPVEPV